MKNSDEFKEYLDKSRKLKDLDISSLGEDEKKAFFINIYNCLILHAIAWDCNKSIFGEKAGRLFFYGCSSYRIGPYVYSLNDIEHGILRNNKISPVPNSNPQFHENDPRISYIMKTLDPRLHFALNCGAKGCPPIAVYKAESIDKQLNRAAKGFLKNIIINKTNNISNIDTNSNSNSNSDATNNGNITYTIRLSMILLWYGNDFGNDNMEMFKYIVQYMDGENATLLNEIIEMNDTNRVVVEFEPYNWTVNGK